MSTNRRKKAKAASIPDQPNREVFQAYAREKGIDPKLAGDQWDVWDAGNWCDGNMTPILNWKSKLLMFAKMEFGMFVQRRAQQKRDVRTERERERESLERMNRKNEQQR